MPFLSTPPGFLSGLAPGVVLGAAVAGEAVDTIHRRRQRAWQASASDLVASVDALLVDGDLTRSLVHQVEALRSRAVRLARAGGGAR